MKTLTKQKDSVNYYLGFFVENANDSGAVRRGYLLLFKQNDYKNMSNNIPNKKFPRAEKYLPLLEYLHLLISIILQGNLFVIIYGFNMKFDMMQAPKLMSVMSILSHLGRNHATVLQEYMNALILSSLSPDSSRYRNILYD